MTRHLRTPKLHNIGPGYCRLCGDPIVVPDVRGVTKAKAIRGAKEVGPGQRLYKQASWHSWCDATARLLWAPTPDGLVAIGRGPECAACGIDVIAVHRRAEKLWSAFRGAAQTRFEHATTLLPAIHHSLALVGYTKVPSRWGWLTRLGQVDHIKPLWAGGKHELDNLQILCQRDHAAKSAAEAAERAALRGVGNRPGSSR